MSTKKDISQYNACTIWKQFTVLANLIKHVLILAYDKINNFDIRSSVKDYSINNLVVDYADNEKIKKTNIRYSEISIQCLFTDLVRLSQFSLF